MFSLATITKFLLSILATIIIIISSSKFAAAQEQDIQYPNAAEVTSITPNSQIIFENRNFGSFELLNTFPSHRESDNVTLLFINCKFTTRFIFASNFTLNKNSKITFVRCSLRILQDATSRINLLAGSALEFFDCLIEPSDTLLVNPSLTQKQKGYPEQFGRGIDIFLTKISNGYDLRFRNNVYNWSTTTYMMTAIPAEYHLPRTGLRLTLDHFTPEESLTEYQQELSLKNHTRDFKMNVRTFGTLDISNNIFITNHGFLAMIFIDFVNFQRRYYEASEYPLWKGQLVNISNNSVDITYIDGFNDEHFGQHLLHLAILGLNTLQDLSFDYVYVHHNNITAIDFSYSRYAVGGYSGFVLGGRATIHNHYNIINSDLLDTKLVSIANNDFDFRPLVPSNRREGDLYHSGSISFVLVLFAYVDVLTIHNNKFFLFRGTGDNLIGLQPSMHHAVKPANGTVGVRPSKYRSERRNIGKIIVTNNNITSRAAHSIYGIRLEFYTYLEFVDLIEISHNYVDVKFDLLYDFENLNYPGSVEGLVTRTKSMIPIQFEASTSFSAGLNFVKNITINYNTLLSGNMPDARGIVMAFNARNITFIEISNNIVNVTQKNTDCNKALDIEQAKTRSGIPVVNAIIFSHHYADLWNVFIVNNDIKVHAECVPSMQGIAIMHAGGPPAGSAAPKFGLFENLKIVDNTISLTREKNVRIESHLGGIVFLNGDPMTYSMGHMEVTKNNIVLNTFVTCPFFGCHGVLIETVNFFTSAKPEDNSYNIHDNTISVTSTQTDDSVNGHGRIMSGIGITVNNAIDFTQDIIQRRALYYLGGEFSGLKFFKVANNNITLYNQKGGSSIGFSIVGAGVVSRIKSMEYLNNSVKILADTAMDGAPSEDRIALFSSLCLYGKFWYLGKDMPAGSSDYQVPFGCEKGIDMTDIDNFVLAHNTLEMMASQTNSKDDQTVYNGQLGSIMNINSGLGITRLLRVEKNSIKFTGLKLPSSSSLLLLPSSMFIFQPYFALTDITVEHMITRENYFHLSLPCSPLSTSIFTLRDFRTVTRPFFEADHRLQMKSIVLTNNTIVFEDNNKNNNCPSSTTISKTRSDAVVDVSASPMIDLFNLSIVEEEIVSTNEANSKLLLESTEDSSQSLSSTATSALSNLHFLLRCFKWNDDHMFLNSKPIKAALPVVGSLNVLNCNGARPPSQSETLTDVDTLTPPQISMTKSSSSSLSVSLEMEDVELGSSAVFEQRALLAQTTVVAANLLSSNPTLVGVVSRGIVLTRLAICDINQKDLTPDKKAFKYTNFSQNLLKQSLEFPRTLFPGLGFANDASGLGNEHRGALFSFSLLLLVVIIGTCFEGKFHQGNWKKYCFDLLRKRKSKKDHLKFVYNENLSCLNYAHVDKFIVKPILFASPFWCDIAGIVIGGSSYFENPIENRFLAIFPLVVAIIIVAYLGTILFKYFSESKKVDRNGNEITDRVKKNKQSNKTNNSKRKISSSLHSDELLQDFERDLENFGGNNNNDSSSSSLSSSTNSNSSKTVVPRHYVEPSDLFCDRGAASPLQLKLRQLLRHKYIGRFFCIGDVLWNSFGKFDDLSEKAFRSGPGVETQFKATMYQYQGPMLLETQEEVHKPKGRRDRSTATRSFELELSPLDHRSSSNNRRSGSSREMIDRDLLQYSSPSSNSKRNSRRHYQDQRQPSSSNNNTRQGDRETSGAREQSTSRRSNSRAGSAYDSPPQRQNNHNRSSQLESSLSSMTTTPSHKYHHKRKQFDFSLRRKLQPLFMTLNVFLTILVCTLGGVSRIDPSTCHTNFIVVFALIILDYLLFLWLRPYIVPLKNVVPVVINFFVVIAGCIYCGLVFSSTALVRSSDTPEKAMVLESTQKQLAAAGDLTTIPGSIAGFVMVAAVGSKLFCLRVSQSRLAVKGDIRACLKKEIDHLEEELLPVMKSNCNKKRHEEENSGSSSGKDSRNRKKEDKKKVSSRNDGGGGGFFASLMT